jgi:hypothetical protein
VSKQPYIMSIESPYQTEHLRKALTSRYEVIAIWGAYQILRLDNDQVLGFLPDFLNSPFPDIQDAGIAKVAEVGAMAFIPDILKIFRESDGQIKYSAAFVLSQFPNDFSRSLIQRWFERLAVSNQSTRMEFEAATFAFLQIDRSDHFPKVADVLLQSHADAIKSSVLFMNLMMFCEKRQDIDLLLDQYFVLRDLHSDAGLTFQLIEHFGQIELKNWWTDQLSRGYTISSIYQQCFRLLNIAESLADQKLWSAVEQAYGQQGTLHNDRPDDHQRFLSELLRWVSHSLDNERTEHRLLWVVQGFIRNERLFRKTIPKIMEMETHFLLSVPLVILLERSVDCWLAHPSDHLETIANYYHSSLLIKDYREEILKRFFPHPPQWEDEQLVITRLHSPLADDANRPEILWRFHRGELLGYDVPWPSIFPSPQYSVHLADGLFRIFRCNFDYFIRKQDRVSIDYALQLFQLKPKRDVIPLLIEHFEYLSHYHTDTFYQTIEYLPDPAFRDLLLTKYQYEEYKIARLLFIICEIFGLPIPEAIRDDLQTLQLDDNETVAVKKPVRLYCGVCHHTFQYSVEAIYVDEGSILRMNRLTSDSVWVQQKFTCKKCGSPVPFVLDEVQLDEFSLQSRVDRILKITPHSQHHHVGQKIILIDFPRYNAITYTPDDFIQLVTEFEANPSAYRSELQELWLKLARLQRSMRNWTACHETLKKVIPTAENETELHFLKGFVNYKLSDFVGARHYFDLIVRPKDGAESSVAVADLIEQARFLLKTMDSAVTKRARFRLIAGKT